MSLSKLRCLSSSSTSRNIQSSLFRTGRPLYQGIVNVSNSTLFFQKSVDNHCINTVRSLSTVLKVDAHNVVKRIINSNTTTMEPSFVPTEQRKYRFFQNVELTSDGIAIVKFDNPEKKVNTISFALKEEAEKLWQTEIQSRIQSVRAVVFISAKKDCFVAGADIFDIQSLEDKKQLIPLIESATHFFQHALKGKQKGASSSIPLVCAIDGPALGAGLEWALWCDYRICTDSNKTKLGLPEVKLGLLPGFGGTQNLHPLVGLQAAMDMMLTGKDIRPDKAKKMGLVDLVVSSHSLEKVAIESARGLADGTIPRSKGIAKKKTLMQRFIEDTSLGRYFMWKTVKEMVDKNTNGHYPAPYAIIDSVKYGLEHPQGDAKFKYEREAFAKLAATRESESLIRIFHGMTQLKKNKYSDSSPVSYKPIQTIAVMGSGLMGAGIAQVSAEKGYTVLLKDRDDAAIERGRNYIYQNWDKSLSKKKLTKYKYNVNSSNIVSLTDQNESWRKHFSNADMVIEAVFEEIGLKRRIVQLCEENTPEHCVFCTNTSAIPISSIAEGARRPESIIGMHYFSPVPQMPLLEIIPHDGTSDRAKAAAFEVGMKQGKTCIEVKDVPGFYVNRCLGPYLVEVSALIRDGVGLERLDQAIKNFGMPVGPITLADEVGVDVTSHVAKFLSNADLGVRMSGGDVSLMEQMVKKGWLGKKSGQGFYTYKGKEKKISPEIQKYVNEFKVQSLTLSEKEIQDRIITRFINEAVKCLEDEIIADPVTGDMGLVFGTGFAPFRGGPFCYIDSIGAGKFVDLMKGFTDKYGPQFEPCQLLKDYAQNHKKFHT